MCSALYRSSHADIFPSFAGGGKGPHFLSCPLDNGIRRLSFFSGLKRKQGVWESPQTQDQLSSATVVHAALQSSTVLLGTAPLCAQPFLGVSLSPTPRALPASSPQGSIRKPLSHMRKWKVLAFLRCERTKQFPAASVRCSSFVLSTAPSCVPLR